MRARSVLSACARLLKGVPGNSARELSKRSARNACRGLLRRSTGLGQNLRWHKIDAAAELRRHYAATGIVRCGNAHGSGQLTLADDVVTTAAHVIYDRDGNCAATASIVISSSRRTVGKFRPTCKSRARSSAPRRPYNQDAVHDWAVVNSPAHCTRPRLPLAKPRWPRRTIRFVARGAIDRAGGRDLSLQDCRLRTGLEDGAEGTRESRLIAPPTSARPGRACSSTARQRAVAMFVGYRSVDPDRPLPFSRRIQFRGDDRGGVPARGGAAGGAAHGCAVGRVVWTDGAFRQRPGPLSGGSHHELAASARERERVG